MNREELWTLAEERVRNADALLAASQWSAAYYLAGYAVECALKAYLPAYLDRTGKIFRERDYIKKLEKCWTHGLTLLVELADLTEQLEKSSRGEFQLEEVLVGRGKLGRNESIRSKDGARRERFIRSDHTRT